MPLTSAGGSNAMNRFYISFHLTQSLILRKLTEEIFKRISIAYGLQLVAYNRAKHGVNFTNGFEHQIRNHRVVVSFPQLESQACVSRHFYRLLHLVLDWLILKELQLVDFFKNNYSCMFPLLKNLSN